MTRYDFEWDSAGNEILWCNKHSIDQIMDSEDFGIIYTECELLELIDNYINSNDLSDEVIDKIFDIKELIQEKIEDDVLSYAIPELL